MLIDDSDSQLLNAQVNNRTDRRSLFGHCHYSSASNVATDYYF